MPDDGVSQLDDIVFGQLEFETRLYDDFVALKSDGFPTYHLASVVDDHHMSISHVMRGKEWISSVPRHVQLYVALGWDMPQFAHLPMILAPDRTKLSKRHGAASVMDYRDMGVLPEALMNYLALLGWSLDDKTEFFATSELIGSFDLRRVSSSDAVFDIDKLLWLNGQHIRNSPDERIESALARYWAESPPDFDVQPDTQAVAEIVPLVRERLEDSARRRASREVCLLRQYSGRSRTGRPERHGCGRHPPDAGSSNMTASLKSRASRRSQLSHS